MSRIGDETDRLKQIAEILGKKSNWVAQNFFDSMGNNAEQRRYAFLKTVSEVTGDAPPNISDRYCEQLFKDWGKGGSLTLAVATYYFLYTQPYGQSIVEDIDKEIFQGRTYKEVFRRQVPGAYVERSAASAHHGTLRPKHQLRLQPPAKSANQLHFSNQMLAMIGRDEEMASLRKFADVEPGFCWVQIAGAAGQGKSRLALELMGSLPDEWSKGFLHRDELDAFASKWRQWEPTSPHLIIIDYVIGAEREIGNAMRSLASKSKEFRVPVRVLLIERQRWDRQWLDVSLMHELNGEAGSTAASLKGCARWFYELNRATDGNDLTHHHFCWNSGLVELRNLSPTRLIQIVRELAEGKADGIDDATLKTRLAQLDSAGRPLYAYLLGMVYRDGQTGDWTKPELLKVTLQREQEKRWPKAFGDTPPNFASDHPALDLAVLASMVRELDCGSLSSETGVRDTGDTVRQQAAAITDTSSNDPLLGASIVIRGLEPDLLGEWFVLTAIEQNLKRARLIDEAWRISPQESAAFMLRSVQNFAGHPTTRRLLDSALPTQEALDAYMTVAQSIYTQLWKEKRTVPTAILEAMIRQAKTGNTVAMTQLGHAYYNGIGTAPNHVKAAMWWHQAADAGDTKGMVSFAACCDQGKGVPESKEASFRWLERASEEGEMFAMALLGNCYLHGIGTVHDMGKAIYWYMEGLTRGEGNSIEMLNRIMADPKLKPSAEAAYYLELRKRSLAAAKADETESRISVGLSRMIQTAKEWLRP